MKTQKKGILIPEVSKDFIMSEFEKIKDVQEDFEKTTKLAFSLLNQNPNDVELIRMTIAVLDSKACYSTNLQMNGGYSVYSKMAEGISSIKQSDYDKIDKTVDIIAGLRETSYCFSFATKWCVFKNPSYYHIFDSYVCSLLYKWNKKSKFTTETILDSYDPEEFSYKNWHKICEDFKVKYDLPLSPLELDKVLFHLGKLYFD